MAGEASYRPISREGASSGDMVFSLGEIRDRYEGAERLRYYARILAAAARGWRIVFDEIVLRRAG